MLLSAVFIFAMLPFTASAFDGTTATVSASGTTAFSDVSSGDWFYGATNFMVKRCSSLSSDGSKG